MEYQTIRGNLMTMINQVNAFDEDELRKKIIKAAINLLDDEDFDGMDKMTKSALIRGVVREVIMEQYPEALDLLSKDENKQADAIYLMGQDVECGLSTKGFVITKNISVAANSNTPEETLKVLATDKDDDVRQSAKLRRD